MKKKTKLGQGLLKGLKEAMDFKHYWLCGACAEARGGIFPEGHICTVIYDVCPYCKETKTIIPYVDFDWPNEDFRFARD